MKHLRKLYKLCLFCILLFTILPSVGASIEILPSSSIIPPKNGQYIMPNQVIKCGRKIIELSVSFLDTTVFIVDPDSGDQRMYQAKRLYDGIYNFPIHPNPREEYHLHLSEPTPYLHLKAKKREDTLVISCKWKHPKKG